MQITDELLEKLGNYFVYYEIHETTGVTFEAFVRRYIAGADYTYS